MHRLTSLLILLLTVTTSAGAARVHVSPAGRTSASGSEGDPVSLGAAFERARTDSTIREIVLAGGVYEILDSLQIFSLARNPENDLVVRAGSPTANVVLRGGRSLNDAWELPATNDPVVSAMPGEARAHIRVVSLYALGVTDFGTHRARGFSNRQLAAGELFIEGRRRPLAGYPNIGESSAAHGIEYGFQKYAEVSAGAVKLPGDLADRLAAASHRGDVWAHGYWGVNWADAHLPALRIDAGTGRMSLGGTPYGGVQGDGAFRIYNLPEELDAPGEWYLARESGLLYYWPAAESDLDRAAFSIIERPILHLKNARNIRFENLTFEASRSDLVRVESSTAVSFRHCQFRGSGMKGLKLNGERNLVEDCLFEGIGDVGIALSGGDQDSLRPGASIAVNNVVREFGEVYLTYSAGIHVRGVGNVVAHNSISRAPHEAIQIHGNLNRITRNEIANVCQFTDDAGAIYSGRDWIAWGNEIVENYIHDIHTQRSGPDWVHAIYIDDFASGFTVRRNIIENVAAYAVNVGGGRYNCIDANLFLNTGGGHLNDNRGSKWIVTTPGENWNMLEGIAKVDRFAEPWKSSFPGLAMIPADPVEALGFVYPDGTEFTDNVGVNVDTWTHEQDWTGRNEGVFSHYTAFDAKSFGASLPDGHALVNQSLRHDVPLMLGDGNSDLAFSQMGLLSDSWETKRTTRGSVFASFTWDAVSPSVGDQIRFRSSTAWASAEDPVLHYEWRINGSAHGKSEELVWTPSYGGVYRITLKVRTASGTQNEVAYRMMVKGSSPPPSGAVPVEDATGFICDTYPVTEAMIQELEAVVDGSGFVTEFAASSGGNSIEVPINFNVILDANRSGAVSEAEVWAQVEVLNAAFFGHGFHFVTNSVRETVNPDWARLQQGSAEERSMKHALAVSSKRFLNVYICPHPRSSKGESTLGYATYPWDYAERDAMEGIIVASRTLPGGLDGGSFDEGDTLVHAVGHYLGLLHERDGGSPMEVAEDARRSVLSAAQGERTITLAHMYRAELAAGNYFWSDAEWSGSQGWRYSSWLQDWVETTGGDWVLHYAHGWIYTGMAAVGNSWFYTWDLGWLMMNEYHPWIYSDKDGWVYYLVGSRKPRWFYRSSTSQWTQL